MHLRPFFGTYGLVSHRVRLVFLFMYTYGLQKAVTVLTDPALGVVGRFDGDDEGVCLGACCRNMRLCFGVVIVGRVVWMLCVAGHVCWSILFTTSTFASSSSLSEWVMSASPYCMDSAVEVIFAVFQT